MSTLFGAAIGNRRIESLPTADMKEYVERAAMGILAEFSRRGIKIYEADKRSV